MARIDAHQHYWDITQVFPVDRLPWFMGQLTYGWKEAGLTSLNRSYLPVELEPQLASKEISRTILINVIHSPGETEWLLKLAQNTESIAGVVGWVNLAQPAQLVQRDLESLSGASKLVGLRHLAQFETDEEWLLRPDVIAGLTILQQRGLPFDLLLTPEQLKVVPQLSEKLPDLDMVINHLAKPYIKDRKLKPWADDMRLAAQNPRVFCKLSGMITEADHKLWTPDDLTPYVETVLEAFGPNRVMYGSDWPVCTLAGSYDQVYEALLYNLRKVLGRLDEKTEQAIFHDSAAHFYRLN